MVCYRGKWRRRPCPLERARAVRCRISGGMFMKNERLKRLISAAMAAALCLSLAGCGKGAQTLS